MPSATHLKCLRTVGTTTWCHSRYFSVKCCESDEGPLAGVERVPVSVKNSFALSGRRCSSHVCSINEAVFHLHLCSCGYPVAASSGGFSPSLGCSSSVTLPRDGLWKVELWGTGSPHVESTEFSFCDPAGFRMSSRRFRQPSQHYKAHRCVDPVQLRGGHQFVVHCGERASTHCCDHFSCPRQHQQVWHFFRRGRRLTFIQMLGAVIALSAGMVYGQARNALYDQSVRAALLPKSAIA